MGDRKIKILAIDDSPDNLISLKAQINDSFPKALLFTALNGTKGIELAATENPDVILLDIVMPGMDGYEVCKILKADTKHSNIPVVFLTAINGGKESRIRALECGAEALLAKPIDQSELIAQVRAMVKIKDANIIQQNENVRLTQLVEEQIRELKLTHTATLNMLEDLSNEVETRKQAEEKMLATLQNLERSNKDLEQFAYVANHDLQEPLRMISSYTQLLERKYKDKLDQDANDYIQFAVNGAIRMQKLLNDLLEFSKINSHAKMNEQVGTSTPLGQAISNLHQLIEENTALITNDDLPAITADESQIIRLFQNLIENAIKFKKKTELPKIHISCTRQKNMYQFSVADNGIGIEMHYHDRVFTIFQRLHSVKHYPGTGIGLSICKRIVERHGGTIWFESTVNQGTTFYFTIPV